MHSALLLPVARCLETIDALFVFMSVVVTLLGSVGSLLCRKIVCEVCCVFL